MGKCSYKIAEVYKMENAEETFNRLYEDWSYNNYYIYDNGRIVWLDNFRLTSKLHEVILQTFRNDKEYDITYGYYLYTLEDKNGNTVPSMKIFMPTEIELNSAMLEYLADKRIELYKEESM